MCGSSRSVASCKESMGLRGGDTGSPKAGGSPGLSPVSRGANGQ